MDNIRLEQHADFETAKADLELGLSGERQAFNTLRDYYGSAAAAMLQGDANFNASCSNQQHRRRTPSLKGF